MTVWMCSGQGAQSEGMGADLLDILEVREVFERASEVLEIDLGAPYKRRKRRRGERYVQRTGAHYGAHGCYR